VRVAQDVPTFCDPKWHAWSCDTIYGERQMAVRAGHELPDIMVLGQGAGTRVIHGELNSSMVRFDASARRESWRVASRLAVEGNYREFTENDRSEMQR